MDGDGAAECAPVMGAHGHDLRGRGDPTGREFVCTYEALRIGYSRTTVYSEMDAVAFSVVVIFFCEHLNIAGSRGMRLCRSYGFGS